jgi:hypothetical protein
VDEHCVDVGRQRRQRCGDRTLTGVAAGNDPDVGAEHLATEKPLDSRHVVCWRSHHHSFHTAAPGERADRVHK